MGLSVSPGEFPFDVTLWFMGWQMCPPAPRKEEDEEEAVFLCPKLGHLSLGVRRGIHLEHERDDAPPRQASRSRACGGTQHHQHMSGGSEGSPIRCVIHSVEPDSGHRQQICTNPALTQNVRQGIAQLQ